MEGIARTGLQKENNGSVTKAELRYVVHFIKTIVILQCVSECVQRAPKIIRWVIGKCWTANLEERPTAEDLVHVLNFEDTFLTQAENSPKINKKIVLVNLFFNTGFIKTLFLSRNIIKIICCNCHFLWRCSTFNKVRSERIGT